MSIPIAKRAHSFVALNRFGYLISVAGYKTFSNEARHFEVTSVNVVD